MSNARALFASSCPIDPNPTISRIFPLNSVNCCGISHNGCCPHFALSWNRTESGKFRAMAISIPIVCSAIGTENTPRGFVTNIPDSRSSG